MRSYPFVKMFVNAVNEVANSFEGNSLGWSKKLEMAENLGNQFFKEKSGQIATRESHPVISNKELVCLRVAASVAEIIRTGISRTLIPP